MIKSPGSRNRPVIALFALAIGILGLHGTAHADLLINDWNDRDAPLAVVPHDSTRVMTPVAFCPCGPRTLAVADATDSSAWLALVGVCIHPPITDPGQGGTVISGSSGGGGGTSHPTSPGGGGDTGTVASTSPEPGSLFIGLIGVGVAGVTNLVRRKRRAEVA
jgi:hypothetical protein